MLKFSNHFVSCFQCQQTLSGKIENNTFISSNNFSANTCRVDVQVNFYKLANL